MKRSERAEPEVITHAGVAAEQGQHPLLESMVAAPVGRAPACLVGECVHDAHPTLLGRVRVRWTEPGQGGEVREQWLACLLGVIVRQQDRVLLQLPDNWPEPVVTGVVDGFAMRPEAARLPGPSVGGQIAGLKHRVPVERDAKPLQPLQNRLERGFRISFLVRVFHAEQELPAIVLNVQEVEQRRSGVAHVEAARWGWREPENGVGHIRD